MNQLTQSPKLRYGMGQILLGRFQGSHWRSRHTDIIEMITRGSVFETMFISLVNFCK